MKKAQVIELLEENKRALVRAHREENWSSAAKLSEVKQRLKKKIRPLCEVCGIPLEPQVRMEEGPPRTCKMHSPRLLSQRARRWVPASLALLLAFSAYAKPKTVPVTVVASPSYAGNVSGAGSYKPNTSVTISASPSPNWSFASWNDGNTQAARAIVASPPSSIWTASFFTNLPPVPSNTTNVTFAWNPVVGSADYHLHIGPSTGVYTNTVSVVGTNATVILPRGTTVFAVVDDTAAASGLTSGLSSEIQVVLPP